MQPGTWHRCSLSLAAPARSSTLAPAGNSPSSSRGDIVSSVLSESSPLADSTSGRNERLERRRRVRASPLAAPSDRAAPASGIVDRNATPSSSPVAKRIRCRPMWRGCFTHPGTGHCPARSARGGPIAGQNRPPGSRPPETGCPRRASIGGRFVGRFHPEIGTPPHESRFCAEIVAARFAASEIASPPRRCALTPPPTSVPSPWCSRSTSRRSGPL